MTVGILKVYLNLNLRVFVTTILTVLILFIPSCIQENTTSSPSPSSPTETHLFPEATQTPTAIATRITEVVPTKPEATKEVLPTSTPVPFQGEIFISEKIVG